MNELWPKVDRYMNLLKRSSKIGTEFTQELQVQQQVLELVRLFGISRMLTLTSIIGETVRLIPKEEKVKLFLPVTPLWSVT